MRFISLYFILKSVFDDQTYHKTENLMFAFVNKKSNLLFATYVLFS